MASRSKVVASGNSTSHLLTSNEYVPPLFPKHHTEVPFFIGSMHSGRVGGLWCRSKVRDQSHVQRVIDIVLPEAQRGAWPVLRI